MAEWSAQRVRSRTRAAVRKREEAVEQDEMESGELNLIPYLDMVTNLMLFMLASVASGLILSQIDTTLPDKAPKGTQVTPPQQNPEDQPLGLYVSIQRNEMILWSVSKLEGTLKAPLPGYTFPRKQGTTGQQCEGPFNCESNTCDKGVCVASNQVPQPVYPYKELNAKLIEVAKKHYNGKLRKRDTYTIVLQADGSIPYSVIVSVMAAMRCPLPAAGQEAQGCMMPNENKDFLDSGEAISKDKKYYNTEKAPYEVEVDNKNQPPMALFPQIQFSSGFE